MKYYMMSEYEMNEILTHLDRLYQLRLMIPGGVEYAAHGIEARKELLAEMIAEYERPADLHEAICKELGIISGLMSHIRGKQSPDL